MVRWHVFDHRIFVPPGFQKIVSPHVHCCFATLKWSQTPQAAQGYFLNIPAQATPLFRGRAYAC